LASSAPSTRSASWISPLALSRPLPWRALRLLLSCHVYYLPSVPPCRLCRNRASRKHRSKGSQAQGAEEHQPCGHLAVAAVGRTRSSGSGRGSGRRHRSRGLPTATPLHGLLTSVLVQVVGARTRGAHPGLKTCVASATILAAPAGRLPNAVCSCAAKRRASGAARLQHQPARAAGEFETRCGNHCARKTPTMEEPILPETTMVRC